MYIKMCPFPEWQREVHKYSEWIKAVEEAYDNMYVQFFLQLTINSLTIVLPL